MKNKNEEILDILEEQQDFVVSFEFNDVIKTVRAKDKETALKMANDMIDDEKTYQEMREEVELEDISFF